MDGIGMKDEIIMYAVVVGSVIIFVAVAFYLSFADLIVFERGCRVKKVVRLIVSEDYVGENTRMLGVYNTDGIYSRYIVKKEVKENDFKLHEGDLIEAVVNGNMEMFSVVVIGNKLKQYKFRAKVVKLISEDIYIVEDEDKQRIEVYGIGNKYIVGDELNLIKKYIDGMEGHEEYTVDCKVHKIKYRGVAGGEFKI